MSVTRYEPWMLANRLHHDLDRLLNRDFGGHEDESHGAVSDWISAVDVQAHGRTTANRQLFFPY